MRFVQAQQEPCLTEKQFYQWNRNSHKFIYTDPILGKKYITFPRRSSIYPLKYKGHKVHKALEQKNNHESHMQSYLAKQLFTLEVLKEQAEALQWTALKLTKYRCATAAKCIMNTVQSKLRKQIHLCLSDQAAQSFCVFNCTLRSTHKMIWKNECTSINNNTKAKNPEKAIKSKEIVNKKLLGK